MAVVVVVAAAVVVAVADSGCGAPAESIEFQSCGVLSSTIGWWAGVTAVNHARRRACSVGSSRGCQKDATTFTRVFARNHPKSMWHSFLSIECHITY